MGRIVYNPAFTGSAGSIPARSKQVEGNLCFFAAFFFLTILNG
jgi:hypothetical protein